MEPTTSLQPTQVQRWLRSDPQDLRALLNALQHSYEDQELSKQTKRPCPAHTHTLNHTHPHTQTHPQTHPHTHPLIPFPFSRGLFFFLKKKNPHLGKVGCSVQEGPRNLCKGANRRQMSTANTLDIAKEALAFKKVRLARSSLPNRSQTLCGEEKPS